MKINQSLISKFKSYSNYIKDIEEYYGEYWKKIVEDFDADLNENGWVNLGKQNFYPIRITADNIELDIQNFININSIKLKNDPHNNILLKNTYSFKFLKEKKIINNNFQKIIEIGPGCGVLSSLILNEKEKKFFIVDIPKMIKISGSFLMTLFPNYRFVFPNEIKDKNDFINGDVIFLLPSQINLIQDDYFDVAINNHSFQEMDYKEIENYLYLIKRSLKKGSYFLCSNRLRKETKFLQYNWKILNNFKILHLDKNKDQKKYNNLITYIDLLSKKGNSDEKNFKIGFLKVFFINNSFHLSERFFWIKRDFKKIIRKLINLKME